MYSDIHTHLSGSTDPIVLWRLIRRAGLKTKSKTFKEFQLSLSMKDNGTHDLSSYLDTLHYIDEIQSSPAGVEESVYSAYQSSYLAGCSDLELRFNPTKRSKNGAIDLDQLIVSGRAGMEKAKADFNMDGHLVMCLGRDCSPQANEALFVKSAKYLNKGVSGIDLAGPYTDNKDSQDLLFEKLYFAANVMGMMTTCHAGEIDHAGVEDELAFVLERLKPKRIGHGIQITKFPKLMKLASKNKVLFEICITSNLMTRAVASLKEYRKILAIFDEHQLPYVICTDATYSLKTNINRENQLHQLIKEEKYDEAALV